MIDLRFSVIFLTFSMFLPAGNNLGSLTEQSSNFEIYFRFQLAFWLIHRVIIKLFRLWCAHSKYLIYLIFDFTWSCNFSAAYYQNAGEVLAAVIIDRLSFMRFSFNNWYLTWSTKNWLCEIQHFLVSGAFFCPKIVANKLV